MNPSELKYNVETAGNSLHFFTQETMRFFGDTMRNYRVHSETVLTLSGPVECWALSRKNRTPKGFGPGVCAYFDKATFKRKHAA
jgi:hypothetical protein